jgi:hypothetical protein
MYSRDVDAIVFDPRYRVDTILVSSNDWFYFPFVQNDIEIVRQQVPTSISLPIIHWYPLVKWMWQLLLDTDFVEERSSTQTIVVVLDTTVAARSGTTVSGC